MSTNIYYVYQYYDPIRKEPIYIGKGKRSRYLNHLSSGCIKIKHPLIQRIQWIRNLGHEPKVTKLYKNLTEKEAFNIEIKLIKKIGRKILNSGPLLNLTEGGEGISGFKFLGKRKLTKATKEKIRKSLLGKKHSQQQNNKMSLLFSNKGNPFYGKHHTIGNKNKISNATSKFFYVTFPSGKTESIKNLFKFCKKYHLTYRIMQSILQNKRSQHKGFSCQYA